MLWNLSSSPAPIHSRPHTTNYSLALSTGSFPPGEKHVQISHVKVNKCQANKNNPPSTSQFHLDIGPFILFLPSLNLLVKKCLGHISHVNLYFLPYNMAPTPPMASLHNLLKLFLPWSHDAHVLNPRDVSILTLFIHTPSSIWFCWVPT